jgi:hypothetical protein
LPIASVILRIGVDTPVTIRIPRNHAEQRRQNQCANDPVPRGTIGVLDRRGFLASAVDLKIDECPQRTLKIVEFRSHVAGVELRRAGVVLHGHLEVLLVLGEITVP